jgi:hypothetical protein
MDRVPRPDARHRGRPAVAGTARGYAHLAGAEVQECSPTRRCPCRSWYDEGAIARRRPREGKGKGEMRWAFPSAIRTPGVAIYTNLMQCTVPHQFGHVILLICMRKYAHIYIYIICICRCPDFRWRSVGGRQRNSTSKQHVTHVTHGRYITAALYL